MDLKKFINEKILRKEEYAEVFFEVNHDEPIYISLCDDKKGLIKKIIINQLKINCRHQD